MARLNTVKSFRGTTKTSDGNLRCGRCSATIKPGDSYRWWANRAPGQRGSYRKIRCSKSECTPTTAEMTPGRRGQLMQIQDDAGKQIWDLEDFTDTSDLESLAESIAEQVRELGAELEESAENIESGFGHETYQSDELRERAEMVNGSADDIEQVQFDDPPDPPETDDEDEQERLAEEYETQLNDWREAQKQMLQDAVDEVDIG